MQWSLLLYCVSEISASSNTPGQIFGVFQADKDADFSQIFESIKKPEPGHPALLPLELFKTHCATTSKALKSILNDVKVVDEELLQETDRQKKPERASELYRQLNRTLHVCNMQLDELRRRRKFESELAGHLQQDLQQETALKLKVDLFSSQSRSWDLVIEGLPGKLGSQRSMVSVVQRVVRISHITSILSHGLVQSELTRGVGSCTT